MTKFISPNDLQNAAIETMLQGRAPISKKDWELCANFWAANIQSGLEESAMPLIGLIFNCPLSKSNLIAIARFQAERKQ